MFDKYLTADIEMIDIQAEIPNFVAVGGGGSVETCTLVVEGSPMFLASLIYQNALGEAVNILADPMAPTSGTYSVVCGSLVYLGLTSSGTISSYENAERAGAAATTVFIITAKAGETASLTVTRKI